MLKHWSLARKLIQVIAIKYVPKSEIGKYNEKKLISDPDEISFKLILHEVFTKNFIASNWIVIN